MRLVIPPLCQRSLVGLRLPGLAYQLIKDLGGLLISNYSFTEELVFFALISDNSCGTFTSITFDNFNLTPCLHEGRLIGHDRLVAE